MNIVAINHINLVFRLKRYSYSYENWFQFWKLCALMAFCTIHYPLYERLFQWKQQGRRWRWRWRRRRSDRITNALDRILVIYSSKYNGNQIYYRISIRIVFSTVYLFICDFFFLSRWLVAVLLFIIHAHHECGKSENLIYCDQSICLTTIKQTFTL